MEMEEEDVTDEDVEVIVVVVDDEDELGADFTVIGVAVPGGRGEYSNFLFPTTFSGISQSNLHTNFATKIAKKALFSCILVKFRYFFPQIFPQILKV